MENLITKIDNLFLQFKMTKAHLGFQSYNNIGAQLSFSAPLYDDSNIHIASIRLKSTFDKNNVIPVSINNELFFNIPIQSIHSLTKKDVDTNNQLTLWLNQNYIVRLCSLLDSHNLWTKTNPIENSIKGAEFIHILKALRHKFAHGSGIFKRANKKHKEIYDRIVALCNLTEKDLEFWHSYHPNDFPLSIDKVLIPITNGCKSYILNLYQ